MVKGLYVAGTSMISNTDRIDVISNNLANVNTTGFKKDRIGVESFNDRLFTRINGSNYAMNVNPTQVTLSNKDDEYTLETTNGYFKVSTEDGIHYTDKVEFVVDIDGYLRTMRKNIGGTFDPLSGDKLLGNKGPIYVGDSDFSVDASGNISVGGTVVDQMLTPNNLNTIGLMSGGVKSVKIMTDFEEGQFETTNQKYDIAIKGNGYFHIQFGDNEYLSRNGAFTINQNSELVTMDGHRVMGIDGPIVIESEDFSINEFGEVIQNGEITNKLKISSYSNVGDLTKVGGTFFTVVPDPTGEELEFDGEIMQGVLEQSNADAIEEMISLIEMNRNYESSQKVITTIDEMLGKAVNDLGQV